LLLSQEEVYHPTAANVDRPLLTTVLENALIVTARILESVRENGQSVPRSLFVNPPSELHDQPVVPLKHRGVEKDRSEQRRTDNVAEQVRVPLSLAEPGHRGIPLPHDCIDNRVGNVRRREESRGGTKPDEQGSGPVAKAVAFPNPLDRVRGVRDG